MRHLKLFLLLSLLLLTGCGNQAQQAFSTDLSRIEADGKLSWLVEIVDEDRRTVMRSYDFSSGSMIDIPMDDEIQNFIPCDDSEMLVAAYQGNGMQIYALVDGEWKLEYGFDDCPNLDRVYGMFGSKLYYEQTSNRIKEAGQKYENYFSNAACYDLETGKHTLYTCEDPLCLSSNGEAVALRERQTGQTRVAYVYRDENGKMQEVEETLPGWSLGLETLDGSWKPLIPIGEDSSLWSVLAAAWLDDEHLLLIADTGEKESYELYRLNVTTCKFESVKDEKGNNIEPYGDYEMDRYSLNISPDGGYIAYISWSLNEDAGVTRHIMVQSLKTGEAWCVFVSGQTLHADGECSEFMSGYNDKTMFWHK